MSKRARICSQLMNWKRLGRYGNEWWNTKVDKTCYEKNERDGAYKTMSLALATKKTKRDPVIN